MDIKKTPTNDIYKSISQDYSGLYKKLQSALGDKCPFAKFDIGAGTYIWSSPDCGWQQMIAASEIKQEFVRDSLAELKDEISSKVGIKTAESLFTIPDDSYIYFDDSKGDIRILLTGWGFKKPVETKGGPDATDLRPKNPVNLSFSYDGVKIPNYNFGLRLSKQVKVLKTGDSGMYTFENLKVGEHYILTDIENEKDFNLCIVDGQSNYDFDVTVFSTVNVKATFNGQPLVGERVHINYNDKEYETVTDSNGSARISVPYHEGVTVSGEVRDAQQSIILHKEDNNLVFSLEKEEPVTSNETEIIVRVLENGIPQFGKEVRISYSDLSYELRTDLNGECRTFVTYSPDSECEVSVVGYPEQKRSLQEGSENLFEFDKVQKKTVAPHILIEGDKGYIPSNYPISVNINGNIRDYVSDESGIVNLPEVTEGETMTITDGLNPTNQQEYVIDSNIDEYVFHIPYEPVQGSKDIKIMVRDKNGNIIPCDHIRFQQDGANELLGQIDNEGNTYFPKTAFEIGKTIRASIIGASKEYPEIPFTLEENEYEYLLQEKEKTPWWMILIEILLVIATILLVWFYWPHLADFCQSAFNNIYN